MRRSLTQAPSKTRLLRWWMLPFVLAGVLVALHPAPFRWLSSSLINAESPRPADVALVLGGDYSGGRIRKGAEMVQQGFVPVALVSGSQGFYGAYECDLAISWALRQGMQPSWFERFPNRARSTAEEASAVAPLLRSRGVKRLMLVTTSFHTARATRIFRAALPDIEVFAVAAPESQFNQDAWWQDREGQKAVFYETTKALSRYLGF